MIPFLNRHQPKQQAVVVTIMTMMMMMMMTMILGTTTVHAFKTTTATTTTTTLISQPTNNRYNNIPTMFRGGGGGDSTKTTTTMRRHFHHRTIMPVPPTSAVTTTHMTTAISAVSAGGSTTMPPPSVPSKWNTDDRIVRSLLASLGCAMTWWLAHSIPNYTIVQACCTTGIISWLLFTSSLIPKLFGASVSVSGVSPRPSSWYSVAMFCGALAGMSGNVLANTIAVSSTSASSSSSIILSSLILPITYFSMCVGGAFGVWDYQKWGVGKGGRLGTIALGGNVLYTITTTLMAFIRQHSQTAATATSTATSTIAAVTFFPASTKQLFASLPIATSLALSTWLLRTSRSTSPTNVDTTATKTAVSNTTADVQQQYIAKILLYCTIAIPMFLPNFGIGGIGGGGGSTPTTTIVSIREYTSTVVSILLGSQAVHRSIGTFGPILPTSMVGLLGSLFFTKSFHGITSPKIFLGALMGLTTIPSFGIMNFLQSSALSGLLFHLQLLDGFGGKLGTLAYIGVLFGM